MSDIIGYPRAHHLAWRTFPLDPPCTKCGIVRPPHCGTIQAALKPSTPPERLLTCRRTGLKYSANPADYEPLCPSCHSKQDRGGKPSKARGYRYVTQWGENSYGQLVGRRVCIKPGEPMPPRWPGDGGES